MITIRPGSQVYKIIVILAVSGEFPMYSVGLIGDAQTYKRKITQLAVEQEFCNYKTREKVKTKLLNISGRGKEKTIRFYKGALPILKWIGFEGYYRAVFDNHSFRGDTVHKNRNHSIGEIYAMCMRAGIKFPPFTVPRLQAEERLTQFKNRIAFYSSRYLKYVNTGEMNKQKFIRIAGAVCAYGVCYAVYNVRNEVMYWHGNGEVKSRMALTDIARMNVYDDYVDNAIVFGKDQEKALTSILALEERGGKYFRLNEIYRNIFFIELSENGIRMFRFFHIPNWSEEILCFLFAEEEQARGRTTIICDAYVDGKYVLSYLDGNIAKLIHFYNATKQGREQAEILCFPFQVEFIKKYFGKDIQLRTIEIETIEKALGIEGGED